MYLIHVPSLERKETTVLARFEWPPFEVPDSGTTYCLFSPSLGHSTLLHSIYQKVKKVGSDVFNKQAYRNQFTRLHATSPS
ncbi:hypothetical protein Mapa_010757 [Marchantia paleacea]|nr:hypothetical protein Mapa_010757 [Marchantia paleacea]